MKIAVLSGKGGTGKSQTLFVTRTAPDASARGPAGPVRSGAVDRSRRLASRRLRVRAARG